MSFRIDNQTITFQDSFIYKKIVCEYQYQSNYFTIDYKNTSKQLFFACTKHSIYDYCLFNKFDWDTKEVYLSKGSFFINTNKIYQSEYTNIYLYLYAKMMAYIKMNEAAIYNQIEKINFDPEQFKENIKPIIGNQIYLIEHIDKYLYYYLKHETHYFSYHPILKWHNYMLYSYLLSSYYFSKIISNNQTMKKLLHFIIISHEPVYIAHLSEAEQCLLMLIIYQHRIQEHKYNKQQRKILKLLNKYIISKYQTIENFSYQEYQLTKKEIHLLKNKVMKR